MRIGITGSIACGKSTVSAYLRSLGYSVLDADAVSRILTQPDGDALPAIAAAFPETVNEDGSLNRKALGNLVFSDVAARKQLEDILHPLIFSRLSEEMEQLEKDQSIVFAEVPLLFECHHEKDYDQIWAVTLNEETQIQRLMERDGFTREEALSRIHSQMSQTEKAARSNQIIPTDGSIEETQAIVRQLLSSLNAEPVNAAPASLSSSAQMPLMSSEELTSDSVKSVSNVETACVQSTEVPAPAKARRRSERQIIHDAGKNSSAQENGSREYLDGIPEWLHPDHRQRVQAPSSPDTKKDSDIHRKVKSSKSTVRQNRKKRKLFSFLPKSYRTPVCIILSLLLILGSIFGVRTFLSYRAEQKRLYTIAMEKKNHPLSYGDLILTYSSKYLVDPALISAVILCESSYKPDAVSRIGARGLMQLMESTAQWIAHRLDEESNYSFDLMFDPETNIRFGTWYLGYLARRYNNDAKKMVCAYHAGQGNVDTWLQNPDYSPDGVTLETIPTNDTASYANRVLSARDIYEKYYFPQRTEEPPEDTSAPL